MQGGFDRPAAVAVDASGRRYVAEYGANRVRVVGRDGAAVASIGGLSGPEGVAVDAAGNVVVADSGNDRVLRFAPSGDGYQLETTIGGLTQPLGVATDPAGAIYVADTYDNRIKRFDPEQPTTSPAGGAPPAVTPPPAASAPGSGAAPRATRARAPALRLRVSQRRDRRRPYRFLLSGRLLRPAGVAAADGCRGRVELRAGAVRRAIRLRRDCRFRSRLTLPRRTRRGLVRLRATFMGNAVLAPRRARTLRARAG